MKFAAVGFLAILSIGCGSDLASVEGSLTLNGEKVKADQGEVATIIFQPEGGSGAIGMALVDEYGNYNLMTGNTVGVEPGVYLVSVNVIKRTPSKNPNSPPNRQRLSPSRYAMPTTSGLKYEIPPGGKQIDIEIVSD